MRIQVVVQHAGPRRAHLLPPLLASLPESALVVSDPGAEHPQRNPWRCYRHCLQVFELPRFKTVSHLLIVQDDAQLCRDFSETIEKVVVAQPANLLALFTPGVGENARRIAEACGKDARWCHLSPNTWVPAVALVWPREIAAAMLAFDDRKRYPESRSADDGRIGDFAGETGTVVLACVPSLVEHPDREPSMVGKFAMGGANPGRIAACWIGEEFSPLDLQW